MRAWRARGSISSDAGSRAPGPLMINVRAPASRPTRAFGPPGTAARWRRREACGVEGQQPRALRPIGVTKPPAARGGARPRAGAGLRSGARLGVLPGQLGGPRAQQVHELARGMERVGDDGAVGEREGRAAGRQPQPPVAALVAHRRCRARRGARAPGRRPGSRSAASLQQRRSSGMRRCVPRDAARV